MNLAQMEMARKRAAALKEFLHDLTWELTELVDFLVDRRVERREVEDDERTGARAGLLRLLSQSMGTHDEGPKEVLPISICIEIATGFKREAHELYVQTLDETEREALKKGTATRPTTSQVAKPAARPAPVPTAPAAASSTQSLEPKGSSAMRGTTDPDDIRVIRGKALKAAADEKAMGWTAISRSVYPNDEDLSMKLMAKLSACALGKALLFDEWATPVARVLGIPAQKLLIRDLTDEERRRYKVDARARGDVAKPRTSVNGRKAARKSSPELNLDVTLSLTHEQIAELLANDDTLVRAEIRGDRIHVTVEADVTLKELFAMKAKEEE